MMKNLLLSLAALVGLVGVSSAQLPGQARIMGTIVSVRGNILHVRPSLRPKLARILVTDKTEVVGVRRADASILKVGMRMRCGGMYNEKTGLNAFFVETSKTPIGELKQPFHGIQQEDGSFAMAGGTIKSLEPFVFVDDDGKEIKADVSHARRIFEDFPMEKNGLLIGTRMFASGTLAPDGVLQADVVSPNRDQSADGTMYGEIVSVSGNTLTVRPRYTQDTITVIRKPGAVLQREVHLDPDRFKRGDTVTIWGQYVRTRPDTPTPAVPRLGALALLVGDGRYPASSDPEEGGVFLTGRLSSLDPVLLSLPDGKSVEIIVPAQMAVARLDTITDSDIKPGKQVMMVLIRTKEDTFETGHIILDASPWVGYGG